MPPENLNNSNDSKPVLLVLSSTFPGAQHTSEPRFVEDLCVNLQSKFNVYVLTQHRPKTRIQEKRNGLTIIRYRYAPEVFELLSENGGISASLKSKPMLALVLPLYILAQILAIVKTIKTIRPDIIHAHWIIPQGFCVVMMKFITRNKTPLLITAHGADLHGFKNKIFRFLKRKTVERAESFCVVSESMKSIASAELELDRTAIPVLSMGADLDNTFVWSAEKTRIPGQMVFVGRLVEKKGVKYLIRSLKDLLETFPELTLVIAGSGPELNQLKDVTRNLGLDSQVTFLGSINHTQIATLFQQSEFAIFPFIQAESGDMEGLGLVIPEAMGCGCPVIAGDVPAISDTVTDGITGLVCSPKTPDSIADKITELHTDSKLREKIGLAGYESARRKYTWSKVADRYAEHIDKILDISRQ